MSNLIQYIIQEDPEEERRRQEERDKGSVLMSNKSAENKPEQAYKYSPNNLLENDFSPKSTEPKPTNLLLAGLKDKQAPNGTTSTKSSSSGLGLGSANQPITPTPWAKSSPKIDIKQEIKSPPISINGNEMSAKDRIDALKSGKKIYINIADNPNASGKLKLDHSPSLGEYYVNKYASQIEKYATQYNLDPDIAKSILYSEASDYHRFGIDHLADLAGLSSSVRPMNIQGKTWGNFQGKQYDVNNPEQNIELGVRVLKSIYDAVPDKDIAKIATLWNGTGLKEVNDYGARTKEYYKNKSWDTSRIRPQIKSK